MIYSTLSPFYARFVRHLVRDPHGYPQFVFDGANKLRPDVTGFTSASDALSWAESLVNDLGAPVIGLKHNCAMLIIDDAWTIYWIPIASALKLCNLIHPP